MVIRCLVTTCDIDMKENINLLALNAVFHNWLQALSVCERRKKKKSCEHIWELHIMSGWEKWLYCCETVRWGFYCLFQGHLVLVMVSPNTSHILLCVAHPGGLCAGSQDREELHQHQKLSCNPKYTYHKTLRQIVKHVNCDCKEWDNIWIITIVMHASKSALPHPLVHGSLVV